MRTTVAVDDHVLAAAKRDARRRGLTLGQLVEDALRHELASGKRSGDPPPEIPVFNGGTGVRPGVDLASNRALRELLDEGRTLDQLR